MTAVGPPEPECSGCSPTPTDADEYVDTVAVHDDVHLVLPDAIPLHAGNHGCDPSTWWLDPFSTVARREIERGEEVTIDYATLTDDETFSMPCRCGAQSCRGVASGNDWRSPALQRRYADHWVPVLRGRITRSPPG